MTYPTGEKENETHIKVKHLGSVESSKDKGTRPRIGAFVSLSLHGQ